MSKKIIYPAVKKALWEAWRAFVPAFLAVIYAQFEAGVDIKNIKAWGVALLTSACVAGVRAVVKYFREQFKGEYERFIFKVPA